MNRFIGACAVSALLLGGLATTAPASAAPAAGAGSAKTISKAAKAIAKTIFLDDGNDARSGIDMNQVKVIRIKGSIIVKTHFLRMGPRLNGVQYYFDTNRKHAGPEYGAMSYRSKDGDGMRGLRMYRMKGWNRVGDRVPCRWNYRWHISGHGPGTYDVTLGLRCFEAQADRKVRVHVRSWDFTKYVGEGRRRHPTRGHDDQMGKPTQFTQWV